MFRAAVENTDSGLLLVLALWYALRTALADCACVICIPISFGSRIRTVLERFTCAAMLRMQTLVCFPVRFQHFLLLTSLGLH